jgi:DNA-binding CsgD family transcriptional regulator/tetratricopeptide (TPR) repeat protein
MQRVVVRRGSADNIPTAAPFGALIDALPALSEAVEAGAGSNRQLLFRRIRAMLATEPSLLILEDLHWADEATLDMVRFIGRRMADLPLIFAVTYRDDEVMPRHPLAIVMGELAGRADITRMSLSPLTTAGVRQLVAAAGASVDADELHRRTGGNAFYATEILATAGDALPATVRDAVLARTANLSSTAQHVLAAAAVLGRPVELDLLVAVSQQPPAAVDECVEHGVFVADGTRVMFRHDLARLAIEESIPPAARSALHARVFGILAAADSADDRTLAHHAAASGDWPAVVEHAPRAAERAARLGAHRQAVEQYRTALRSPQLPKALRARLCEALSYECYVTDQVEEALVARQQAMELFELAGDTERVGAAQRWLSRFSWFLGRNDDAERYASRAIETLEPFGDGHELAMAYSNMAQLRALSHDADDAVEWGGRALDLAHRLDDREVRTHALNNVGTAMRMLGKAADGRQMLTRSLDIALADDAHEHAARAYTNLGFSAAASREFASAEHDLRAGIAYCEERDLDSWSGYMSASLATVMTEQGRYDEAAELADRILAHPNLAPISRIPAAVTRGRIATLRGEDGSALLDDALRTAAATGESQRLVPVAAARAEAAWLTGQTDAIEAAVRIAWDVAVAHPDPWELGELSWWLTRAGVAAASPITVAEPFDLMLAGRWVEAAECWRGLGCPVWTALCLAEQPDLEAGRAAVALTESLGVPAMQAALLRSRHAAGLPMPRGPRPTTLTNSARLTAREVEVLGLVADGLSNAEVAERLYLSGRTVGHHMSAVLRKLGETSRGRAVAAARRDGILPSNIGISPDAGAPGRGVN